MVTQGVILEVTQGVTQDQMVTQGVIQDQMVSQGILDVQEVLEVTQEVMDTLDLGETVETQTEATLEGAETPETALTPEITVEVTPKNINKLLYNFKFKPPYIARETEIAHMLKKIKESMNRKDNQKCILVN